MSSSFFQSFNCILSPRSILSKQNQNELMNVDAIKTPIENKTAYSLKQKKYIQKNYKIKTSLRRANQNRQIDLNRQAKENLKNIPKQRQQKKLYISPQISLKQLPTGIPNRNSLKLTKINTICLDNKSQKSFSNKLSIQSQFSTQLLRAQQKIYFQQFIMKKQISNQSTQIKEYSQDQNTSLKKNINSNEFNHLTLTDCNKDKRDVHTNMHQRKSRPYTSVLIPQKLKFIPVDQDQSDRSPSLRDLNVQSFKNNGKHMEQQKCNNSCLNSTTLYAINNSIAPSNRSRGMNRLKDMQIRSTKSIKEEQESVDQFSQVLNMSRHSFQDKFTTRSKV